MNAQRIGPTHGTVIVTSMVEGAPSAAFHFANRYLADVPIKAAGVSPLKRSRNRFSSEIYGVNLGQVTAKEMKLADIWLGRLSGTLTADQIAMAESLHRLLFAACKDRGLLPNHIPQLTDMLEVWLAFDVPASCLSGLAAAIDLEQLSTMRVQIAYRSNPEVAIAFRPLPNWRHSQAQHEAEFNEFARYLDRETQVQVLQAAATIRSLYRRKMQTRRDRVIRLARQKLGPRADAWLNGSHRGSVRIESIDYEFDDLMAYLTGLEMPTDTRRPRRPRRVVLHDRKQGT